MWTSRTTVKKIIKARTPWLQAPFAASMGKSRASVAAFFLLFILALSLPPKWASWNMAGLVLVFVIGFARREDWRSVAVRSFLLYTALWLVPVLATTGLQHILNVATASAWYEPLVLVLRMLGIGLGIIILVERGWLTLHTATLALICALSIHAGAGFLEWLVSSAASSGAWRELRVAGLVSNPNPFGSFMALTAILAAGLLRGQRYRPFLWGLLILALFDVWASGSRGALLAVGVGMVVLFPPSSQKRLIVYLGCAAMVAALYLYTGVRILSPDSDSERLMAFSFAAEKIRQAPWLGWGVDAYARLPGRIGPAAPHNMLLDLALSSGLVALAGWIISTTLLTYRLIRCERSAAQLTLAILAAAVLAGTLEYSLLISTHFRGIWVIVTALACSTLGTCIPAAQAAPRSLPAHERNPHAHTPTR